MQQEGKVSYFWGVLFVSAIVGLYGAIYAIDGKLPKPLKFEDELTNIDSFITESARAYLKPLVEIGPKVVGHENNEIHAVAYLKKTIETIITNSHESQKITFDHQSESGSFFIDFKPNGAINTYSNIQNLIVKIHSESNSKNSILINAHFDTVPNSPGGSDDGINVAIALEVLRKLAMAKQKPKNNLIFLFNGAEEVAMCGSHAFITKHDLRNEVKVFVNLEASGAGGKEILFQTGPEEPWLLKYYDVPHPHANAGAEEVFQSNVIPSDTDFRIFRDFGNLIGYDFAYYKDGYRYHTKYDNFENIDEGSFQHTGDNILHLIKNLAEADEVENPKTEGGKTVFYDVFGLFFIHYSMETNIIVNSVIATVSILLAIWGCISVDLGNISVSLIYTTLVLFITLLGWVITTAIILLTATILDLTNRSMSWYSVPSLNFLLYVAPTVGCMIITTIVKNKVMRHKTLSLSGKALIQVHVIRLIWTLPLLVLTILGFRVSIFFLFGVLFNTAAMTIIHVLDIYLPKLTSKIWPTIHIISMIIPTMIIYTYAHQDIALFTPIFGRFGADMNPDLLMGLIVSSFVIVIGSYYIPLLTFINKPWYIFMVMLACFLSGIILAYTPVGFPYTFDENSPKLQRYTIYHTKRLIRNDLNEEIISDSGFYFFKNDRNTPHSIESEVSFMDRAESLEDVCKIAPGCGVPVTNSRNIKNIGESIWIPSTTDPFDSNIKYSYSTIDLPSNKKRYNFEISGSDKIDVYLSIRNGYVLTELSLLEELPKNYIDWNGQVTYYIAFVYGKVESKFEFSFVVAREDGSDWSSPAVDLAITTKHVHNVIAKSGEYKEFLNEFPEWTAITVSGLAQYENLVLS